MTFEEHILWGVEHGKNNFWLSSLYDFMFCDKNHNLLLDEVVLFENFISRIDEIFKQLNISQETKVKKHTGYKNASRREHYSEYYTQETIDIISSKDKLIIDKFKYTF